MRFLLCGSLAYIRQVDGRICLVFGLLTLSLGLIRVSWLLRCVQRTLDNLLRHD